VPDRPPRTLLEQRIRQRCMTYEEFVQHAQTFACDNREPGTLSLRHLQRLASGRPLGTLRPATARLLEHLLDEPIAALLAPPKTGADEGENPASELRQLLDAARRVDRSVIVLLHQQLDAIRRLDRQLGAMDRTRSCRHSVVTAADCQRRKSRGDTPKLHPGIQGRGR
jgi:hypothetical protein